MNCCRLYRVFTTALLLVLGAGLASAGLAAAAPPYEADPVRFNVASLAEPGQRVLLLFEIKNISANTWAPGAVSLSNVKNPLGAPAQNTVSRSVLPNETFYWDFEVKAPSSTGVHESTWQIMRGGTAISAQLVCYVIVVPKEAKEMRDKIQRLIDDFSRQRGPGVDQLIREIKDLLAREGQGIIDRIVASRCGLASGMLFLLGVTLRRRSGV